MAATTIAAPAHAGFAPMVDRPYRYLIVETRNDGAADQRFVLDRTLTFHRERDGYTAELAFVASSGDATGPAALFIRMAHTLAKTRIVYHLDAAGQITEIENRAATWSKLVAAIDAGVAGSHHSISGPAVAFAAMPPAEQDAYLRSMIALLIVPADAARADGSRPVKLPAEGPGVAAFTLAGSETVSHAADGLVDVALSAAGEQPALLSPTSVDRDMVDPSLSQPTRIAVLIRRRIDPVTGLIAERRQERTTTIGERRATIVTSTTLQLMVR